MHSWFIEELVLNDRTIIYILAISILVSALTLLQVSLSRIPNNDLELPLNGFTLYYMGVSETTRWPNCD